MRKKNLNDTLWTREQAISDLVNIKNKCVDVMTQLKTNDVEVIDAKVATIAFNAIKELNNMNGYNDSGSNPQIDKVVISDDL